MSATALISVSSKRRVHRAHTWLRDRPSTEELLLVGTTLDAVNELARTVAQERGAAFGWHRFTLRKLAVVFAAPKMAERSEVPISRIGANAIAARVVHRLRSEGGVTAYRAVAEAPGFPRAVGDVIAEVRLTGLLPDTVGAVAPDLAAIMRAYEAELADAALTDWPRVLAVATEVVSSADRPRLAGLPLLLLDVPIATDAELAFVQALSAAAPSLLVTIPAADLATRARVRDGLGMVVEDLDQYSTSELGTIGCLERLQRRLFQKNVEFAGPTDGDKIEVFSAPGEGRECVEIARRVLGLAKRAVPFDRIAVLLRSPEEYRAHLKEAFGRAGIPAHFARGAVRPEPAGRAFYALLRCKAENLSARRFAEYLSLSQVPDATPGGTPPDAALSGDRWAPPDPEVTAAVPSEENVESSRPPVPTHSGDAEPPVRDGALIAPRRWERLLVEAAVIGGCNRWQRRIDGLRNELRRSLQELTDEDETQAAMLARKLDELTALANYALPLIGELDRLPPAAQWSEWLDRLSALATRALRYPDHVLAILSELAPMAPVGPAGLGEVLGILQDLLLETAVRPSSQRYGRVFVGPIDAARGLTFDAVFVPGLAEKMFPRKIIEEPILLDEQRDKISADLATNQSRLERERLALALAVGATQGMVCFSYPRLEIDHARPRVPSFYALEAVRAAEGELPDFAELARRADTASTRSARMARST